MHVVFFTVSFFVSFVQKSADSFARCSTTTDCVPSSMYTYFATYTKIYFYIYTNTCPAGDLGWNGIEREFSSNCVEFLILRSHFPVWLSRENRATIREIIAVDGRSNESRIIQLMGHREEKTLNSLEVMEHTNSQTENTRHRIRELLRI